MGVPVIVAAAGLALLTACGGGGAADSTPAPPAFPQQTLDFFDATRVNPGATGFQCADYDPGSRRVFFFPWGGYISNPSGRMLAFHTDQDFFSPASYEYIDLAAAVDPDAQGFGCGFLDLAGRWMYLVPLRKDRGRGIEGNDLALRCRLDRPISDPAAWERFHLASLPVPVPQTGWITGAFANGAAYFVPYGTPTQGDPWFYLHGCLLRFDAAKPFGDPSAWSWFDLKRIDPAGFGFQSVAVVGRWLYLVPYDQNVLVRYDTSRPFADPSSYEKVDLASLDPRALGYTGAIVSGDSLVLVPWRNLHEPVHDRQGRSVAARFDTRRALADPGAWAFFDLKSLDAGAAGYQFGWADRSGFVHFSPTNDFVTTTPPPFVVWNSALPFTSPGSWRAYPSAGMPLSAGSAFDGVRAYIAPFGINGTSGRITRVTSTFGP